MPSLPFRALFVVGLSTLVSCVATPRFSQSIQASVVQHDMMRLETEKLVLYYPEPYREEALRVAARLEYCRGEVEKLTRIKDGVAATKSTFVLPEIELNNAYVNPPAGVQQIAVLPLFATAHGFFMSLGIPPDAGIIGCHEMVHDVHARQVSGAAQAIRHVLGQYYTPQSGLDPWFWEGLAVYFETKLQGVGRLESPYFDGHFAAGIAGTTITGDDLNYVNRAYKFGAMYIVGAHFVDYLARTYGEEKLFEVIATKSNEIIFPIANNNDFKRVYGKNLSALIDDFAEDTKRHYQPRMRPADQTPVRYHEQSTELFWARSGHSVILKQGLDQQARVTVYDPQGRELLSHLLNDIGIGRRLLQTSVDLVSGLSMTADGKHVYFVAADVAAAGEVGGFNNYESRLIHIDVAADAIEVVDADIHASGGSISPDGSRYYLSLPAADTLGLAFYDLATHATHIITTPPWRTYLGLPMVSPDGSKLAVTEAGDDFFHLGVYDATTGAKLSSIAAPPGQVLQPSWVDDTHVVYAGVADKRMQVFEADLTTGTYRQLTQAPYVVARPFVHGNRLKFLNREHWFWTEDEVVYAALDVVVTEDAPSQVVIAEDAPPAEGEQAVAVDEETTLPTFSAAANSQRPLDKDVVVESEKPYSAFEHLFVPQIWSPWFIQREKSHWAVGAMVNGGDVLGYHRWALYAGYDASAKFPTVGVSYINSQLAPFRVQLDSALIGREEGNTRDLAPRPGVPVRIQERLASLQLARDWYASWTTFVGGRYIGAKYQRDSDSAELANLEFGGPLAGIAFRSFDSTPYGGTRRGLSLSTMATYFPAQWSSTTYDLTDGDARLTGVIPLPFSKRHKLTLHSSGRALFGAPHDSRLLQVGGSGNSTVSVGHLGDADDDLKGVGVLPPGLRFYQALRGFEDLAIFGRYVVTGEAVYTYPFILDWGTASTLRFLPATAIRQIDVDLFGSGASFIDKGRESAFAVGTAINFRLLLWQAPATITIQGSRRLTYDRDFAFYFAVGPG